jgi:uncharacterized protein (TIGR03437 family)
MDISSSTSSRGAFLAPAVWLLVLPWAALGAQLAVDSLALSPGGSGTVQTSYTSRGDQISALQFDIQFDSSALSLIVIPGTSARSASKNLYNADLGAGWHRILVAGLNQHLLSDGPIVTLFVIVLPSANAGAAYSINITNALAADQNGNAVPIPDASGSIAILGQFGDVAAIQTGGVLNAASLLPGAISPGEVITLFGSGIGPLQPAALQVLPSGLVSTNLSNTIVSFDSVQAPVLYAGLNQINVVVPFEVFGKSGTVLTISRGGQQTPPLPLPITTAAPSIFTQDATGLGQAVALNQDGSLNTPLNPAGQGSILTLYLTGAGQTNPPGLTGGVTGGPGSTVLSTTATIQGIPAEVLYSGPAPGLIAGVSQVNLRVPAGASSSLAAPISIRIGNAVTQDGVALSLQ